MQHSKKRVPPNFPEPTALFRRALLALVILLLSNTLMAQTGISSTILDLEIPRSALQARGVRLTFLKPIFDITSEGSAQGQTARSEGRENDVASISAGYAFLPIDAIGWSTNFGYLKLKDEKQVVDLIKVDANVGFAFNKKFALSAGPNISKFTSGTTAKQLQAGFGYQIFMSIQSTENIGLDLGYISMKQSGDAQVNSSTVNYKLEERGPTVGLHVTFE